MTSRVARISHQQHVRAAVALDTVFPLAERAGNLLQSGRRMTLVRRYLDSEAAPDVTAGLTLAEPVKTWSENGMAGMAAHFAGGSILDSIGFSTEPVDCEIEEQVWKRYHAGCRRDITIVHINGGFTGNGPCRGDLIRVVNYTERGLGIEKIVAFDPGVDPDTEPGCKS